MGQEAENTELFSSNTIRTETVLSRFPVHRLAKRGSIRIDIREIASDGEVKTLWEVSHNSKYGQPGPLAYKVDSLIINRRIDEAPRPIPKIIRLGSLRDICRELDINEGQATCNIKKALLQNASAFITARRSYKGSDGIERTAEISDTRYGVVFTGEKFPDGKKADAVYILLHDSYMEIINTAQTRPLDYDYLRELPPAPQRFYELLSFQIFAALKNERPRAKMLYSYYCTRAPQTRYFDYEHVKKQMYKVHAPHKKSGYISAVELRETTDTEGRADWEMLYTPGRKAKAEFRAFSEPNRTLGKKRKQPTQLELPAVTEPAEPPPAAIHPAALEDEPLVTKLIGFHIAEPTARELVRDYRKSVELQLRALPHRNLNKIRDLASWLVVAIKESHQLPEAITEALARDEEVKRAKAKKEAAEARQRDEEARRAAYFDYLRVRAGQTEKEQPEAYRAFLDDTAAKRAELERDPTHKGTAKKIHLRLFDDEQSQLERFRDYFNEPNLEEWQSRQLEP
jgi:hypothetical protein